MTPFDVLKQEVLVDPSLAGNMIAATGQCTKCGKRVTVTVNAGGLKVFEPPTPEDVASHKGGKAFLPPTHKCTPQAAT